MFVPFYQVLTDSLNGRGASSCHAGDCLFLQLGADGMARSGFCALVNNRDHTHGNRFGRTVAVRHPPIHNEESLALGRPRPREGKFGNNHAEGQ